VAGITSYKTTGWWFGIFFIFPYWEEESQLTNSYFSEGQAQPPTSHDREWHGSVALTEAEKKADRDADSCS
jgi:hypothetical protein